MDLWTRAPYEREGDVGYVTFPCGYTLGADGDAINLYYTAADTSIAMATGSVGQLLRWLDQHGTDSQTMVDSDDSRDDEGERRNQQ